MSKVKKRIGAQGPAGPEDLPAGRFSSWLRRTRSALAREKGVDVPCGACTACCKSSYFIHIRPGEARTLNRIPGKLLVPAPGLPKGHVLLGHYENGRCPMLIDDKCSIYEHRPLTCRSYDCRIFSAAGMAAGDDGKIRITQRIRRWKFSYPAQRDRNQHSAVQAAAKFLQEQAECFPAGVVPGNPTQVAVFAIKVYGVFLKSGRESGGIGRLSPVSTAKAIMRAHKKFGRSGLEYQKGVKP